jgi:hypothetical protein
MKKKIWAFSCLVILSSPLNSQGQTPAALERDNVFTGTNIFAQPGIYRGSGSPINDYLSVFLNGYTEPSGSGGGMTNAISVGGITPQSANLVNITGISTRMTSNCNSLSRTRCNTVGGYFVANANANGAGVWGINPIVQDFAGISNANLQGEEIDMAISGTPQFVRGIAILAGGSGTPPTNSIGVEISGAMSGGRNAFNRGLSIDAGAASLYGIQMGATGVGTNVGSMLMAFQRYDSGGVVHNDVTENSNALGDLLLAVASGRAITAGGAMFGSGSASSTDTNGQLEFRNSTTSASYNFAGTYKSAPICTFSPLADPGSGVRIWISALSTSTLQLTASSSISLTVDYQCSKRN